MTVFGYFKLYYGIFYDPLLNITKSVEFKGKSNTYSHFLVALSIAEILAILSRQLNSNMRNLEKPHRP